MEFFTKTPLWPHQKDALLFGYDKDAVGYFLDMGTGKSKVAIDEIVNHAFKLTLIFCPLSVVDVWPIEFEKHSPVHFQLLYPGAKEDTTRFIKRIEAADFSLPTVIIVNYERVTPRKNPKTGVVFSALGDLLLTVAKEGSIDAIYCDESHRIKAAGASSSRYCHKIAKRVPIRRALTGTPMADKPLDVYGQFRFLDEEIYGTNFKNFKKEYCEVIDGPSEFVDIVVGYRDDKRKQFTEKFHSIGFVVKAEDVQKLPKTQHIYRNCHLNPKAARIYQDVEKEFIAWLEENDEASGQVVTSNALVQMLRLHQITSGLVTYEKELEPTVYERFQKEIDTSKRELLKDLLTDFSKDEPVVIFYRYKHDLMNIRKVCKKLGRSLCELNGENKQWKEFQYDKKYDTIAVNIRSGGAGINLTRARFHVFYTVGLSNADYRQALKRGHRHDDTYKHKSVVYYHLVIPGTMDEMIKNRLEEKGNLVNSLIQGYRERYRGRVH